MSSKSGLTMAALRLAMPPNEGIATLFGVNPSVTNPHTGVAAATAPWYIPRVLSDGP